jgi:predicted nucleic acid-binding protein
LKDGRLKHLIQIAQSIIRFESFAKIKLSADETDNKFIELAIDSQSSIIISGDPDLKNIQVYAGIEIISPSIFFDRYQNSSK